VGSSAAHVRYKHLTVVDDDIGTSMTMRGLDWAIAYRVNAGENDIVIMPDTFGLALILDTQARSQPTAFWHRKMEPRA